MNHLLKMDKTTRSFMFTFLLVRCILGILSILAIPVCIFYLHKFYTIIPIFLVVGIFLIYTALVKLTIVADKDVEFADHVDEETLGEILYTYTSDTVIRWDKLFLSNVTVLRGNAKLLVIPKL